MISDKAATQLPLGNQNQTIANQMRRSTNFHSFKHKTWNNPHKLNKKKYSTPEAFH